MKKEGLFLYFPAYQPVYAKKLREYFGSMESAWEGSKSDYLEAGLSPNVANKIIDWKKQVDEKELAAILKKQEITLCTITDPAYPANLASIYDPPGALFLRGSLPDSSYTYLSIIGSRKNTSYGASVTRAFVKDLASYPICIVSGLAFGIDSIAHKAAIEYNLPTIAILPSGIDQESITPRSHISLSEQIIKKKGALISELPPGTPAYKSSFRQRNRIIAGISPATLVIEASDRSGTRMTAGYARDEGRDVLAIPHPITSPTAKGVHILIQEGAHLVQDVDDIIQILGLKKQKTVSTHTEYPLLGFLANGPIHINTLLAKAEISNAELSTQLIELELEGYIQNDAGILSLLPKG